jgi:plasmid maintenance system antidote protein VapI
LAEGGQTVVRWSNADHWLRLQTAYDLAQARKRQDQIKVERYKRQSAA